MHLNGITMHFNDFSCIFWVNFDKTFFFETFLLLVTRYYCQIIFCYNSVCLFLFGLRFFLRNSSIFFTHEIYISREQVSADVSSINILKRCKQMSYSIISIIHHFPVQIFLDFFHHFPVQDFLGFSISQ